MKKEVCKRGPSLGDIILFNSAVAEESIFYQPRSQDKISPNGLKVWELENKDRIINKRKRRMNSQTIRLSLNPKGKGFFVQTYQSHSRDKRVLMVVFFTALMLETSSTAMVSSSLTLQTIPRFLCYL